MIKSDNRKSCRVSRLLRCTTISNIPTQSPPSLFIFILPWKNKKTHLCKDKTKQWSLFNQVEVPLSADRWATAGRIQHLTRLNPFLVDNEEIYYIVKQTVTFFKVSLNQHILITLLYLIKLNILPDRPSTCTHHTNTNLDPTVLENALKNSSFDTKVFLILWIWASLFVTF